MFKIIGTLIVLLLTGCASKTPGPVIAIPEKEPVKQDENGLGIIDIKRTGPGYDVSLALDTGEDNVAFIMDIPESGQKPEPASPANTFAEQDNAEVSFREQTNQEPVQTQESETTDSLSAIPSVKPKKDSSIQTVPITNENRNANDYIVSAQQKFYENDLYGALLQAQNAVEIDPEAAFGWALLGSIHYQLGQLPSAKTAWQKALSLNPKLVSVRQSLELLFNDP